MIGIISAVSANGIIGCDGSLPWNYPEDFKHFKKITLNNVVIMGRKTFESIDKPLPKRENIVISSKPLDVPGTQCFISIESFFKEEKLIIRNKIINYWFIGGAKIYEEGMKFADEIILTITPDIISEPNVVRFPFINPLKFACVAMLPMEADPRLTIVNYKRI